MDDVNGGEMQDAATLTKSGVLALVEKRSATQPPSFAFVGTGRAPERSTRS